MKKKRLVLIGIAICAILLASPMLASAGYSKIYGNANEDDVLDMRDVTYIKLVIFGKKPDTTFADANNDGKISMLDIGQTKLIILGKEKELTFVDRADRTVTVPRPIERVVACHPASIRAIIALGECDKLVGVGKYGKMCTCYSSWKRKSILEDAPICIAGVCGGRLLKLPKIPSEGCGCGVGAAELILSLKPDVIFDDCAIRADPLQEKTGIPSVCPFGHRPGPSLENEFEMIEIVGKVLEKEEEAEELISFMEEKIDKVKGVTSQIPEEEKPKIYLSSRQVGARWGITRTDPFYDPLVIAGGINVAKDVRGESAVTTEVTISKEQIIKWDPDIIILASIDLKDDPYATVEAVLLDPDLQTMNAVKNESVYYCLFPYCCGMLPARDIVNTMYLAKRFHPDKFPDLDVEEEGNEIYERFFGVDGLFSEFADYTIWMREWLDSQK